MSNIWFFLIFLVAIFLILGVALKIRPKDAAFTIAIGAVIAANIYNSISYPISMLGLTFGIDSVVYTIFAFCLLFTHIEYGKESMKLVLYTSMFSIFFTAFLFFMGTLSQTGYTPELLISTLSYLNSIIGTFLAAMAMVWVYDWLRKKGVNIFVAILVGLLVVSVVNSIIYFGLSALYGAFVVEGFLTNLAGSYIGKAVASLACLGIFVLVRLKKKEED